MQVKRLKLVSNGLKKHLEIFKLGCILFLSLVVAPVIVIGAAVYVLSFFPPWFLAPTIAFGACWVLGAAVS